MSSGVQTSAAGDVLVDAAAALAALAEGPEGAAVGAAGEALGGVLGSGGTAFFCGNGGSAAEASHLAAELTGRLVAERRPLAGVSLSADLAAVTAIANDYGTESMFARQLAGLARPGDALVVLSTSGTSPNVVAAVHTATELGLLTIGLLGGSRVPLDDLLDHALHAPGATSGIVQVGHLALGHALLAAAESTALGPAS